VLRVAVGKAYSVLIEPGVHVSLQSLEDWKHWITLRPYITNVCLQVRQMRVRLEEARSSMSAARSQGKVLESLMQLKSSGQLPGIHGRLVCYNIFVLL